MTGKVVWEKPPIFTLREQNQPWMDKLTAGVSDFIARNNFYPSVFYNENDINHPFGGIRYAIPNLDKYSGVFVHQDAPDTPIDGFKGVEFRSSITKSWAKMTGNQLLWTVQDLTHLPPLPPSEYHDEPSVQFCGTAVLRSDGTPFPQQYPRFVALDALEKSGLDTEINLKVQRFDAGKFIEVSGNHLSDEQYWKQMEMHPYGLSVRGWGNWDFRMYEMLSTGRIPVHVSTDDELLFERDIPWNEYMVIVDDIRQIRQTVTEFHSQFTDSRSLAAHQKKLTKIYREYLSFPAFCKRFEEYYEEDIRRILR